MEKNGLALLEFYGTDLIMYIIQMFILKHNLCPLIILLNVQVFIYT